MYIYFHLTKEKAETRDVGNERRASGARKPYNPKKYEEAWVVAGRRSSKTDGVASTIVAYEATCGGHEKWIRPGQEAVCFLIAQDLRMARSALMFIRATIEMSSVLKKEIIAGTSESVTFKNHLTIACIPPSLRSVRGYAN